jgi:CubicO group peptidase (beta-lactamase class C family)
VEGKWHVYPEMAAAGLWTTPSDLARAGIDLQLILKGEPKRLLPKERVVEMLTHGVAEEIGIGFFLEGKDKSVRFGHGGVDEGFIATMTMYKDHGMGAVIMINSNEAMPLLDEIKRAVAKEYEWPEYFPKEKEAVKLSPEALDAHVGEYVSKSGLAISITKENDRLMLKLATQPPIELQPESETKFFIMTLNTTVTFDKAKEGKTKGLTLRQEGKDTSAERKQ